MDITDKHVDAVIVGSGWTGMIMAKELTEAGLKVVILERGPARDTYPDGAYPKTMDELAFIQRTRLFQDMSKSTVTIRHGVDDVAVPYRQIGAFKPGTGLGGAGLHWSGQHWRVFPEELQLRSHYEQKYGKNFIPPDMTIADWGVSYDELEPHFTFAEQVFGTSGQAYRVNNQVVGHGDGNFFEANRSAPYPTVPQKNPYSAMIFWKACAENGLHPFSQPSANVSVPYTNPYGCQMGPCTFCGYCSGYACFNYSKASPNVNILPALRLSPNFELRTDANVLKINLDSTGKKATGVTYVDSQGNTHTQPADLVITGTFAYNNAHLLLVSGIGQPYDPKTGEGVVGKNLVYQTMASIQAFFDPGKFTNPFIGAGGNAVAIDDYNGDNFDHGPAGFVGGAPVWCNQAGTKPIGGIPVPEGTPKWGGAWKKAVTDSYVNTVSFDIHGTNMAYQDCYLSLDPTYKDSFGQPLLRFTFDWHDNDIKMSRWIVDKMTPVAQSMNAKSIKITQKKFGDHFDTRPYQTTHLAGGTMMGTDPKKSVVNRYLQSWDVSNLFVVGSGVFPQGLGYNPTGMVVALAYWSAKAIREQYLKNPGPLVSA
jgi:gluconate 2-dehydrogenase alpha chain